MVKSLRCAMVVFAMIFSGFVCISSARAEQVDSPAYQSWAKQKVGTSVTYSSQMNGAPMQMMQTTTYTLKEIAPDKVTVQIDTKMDMGGMTRQAPPQTISYPAKVDKDQEYTPANFTGTIKEAGKETIDAGGKKYDCRVFEFTGQSTQPGRGGAAPANATGKIWRNEEIPGGLAKMQMDMAMAQMNVTMVMTLSSIDAK